MAEVRLYREIITFLFFTELQTLFHLKCIVAAQWLGYRLRIVDGVSTNAKKHQNIFTFVHTEMQNYKAINQHKH
jgi:hypothetical protein